MPYKITYSEVGSPHTPSRKSEYAVVESTGYLVAMLGRLFRRSANARMEKYGIAQGQWPVLLMLWSQDGLSQNELSRRIAVEAPTMARTLNRMERDGLVRRRRNDVDLRQISVVLTPHGRSLRDKIVPCAIEVEELAKANISRKDAKMIHAALRKMILALRVDQSGS